jgi:hypothetical protein
MGDHFPHLRMGYISNLIRELNRTGVFKDRIQIMGITKGSRSINIANFGKGIEDRRLVHITGKVAPEWNLLNRKEISDTYPKVPQTKATKILNVFFRTVRDSHKDDWEARGKGFLCTNNGINVMLRVLVEVLKYYGGKISSEKVMNLLKPKDGVNILKDYIDGQDVGQLVKDTSSETKRERVATDIIEAIHQYNKKFAHDYLCDHDRIQ